MPLDVGRMSGYLLLADISGYTKFLTGTELEHSHAIVTELTKLIRSRLVPPMRFVKLEGDAVFCFAGADAFPDGEQVLELVESCYFDFTSRLLDMARSTTCTCDACRAIGGLGLKFIVHFGEFMVDRDDGRVDLAGPEVILAHRLLKNTVIESGGPKAYAFMSAKCFSQRQRELRLPVHSESYDSFGEVTGFIQDLADVADRRRDAQRVRVSVDEADVHRRRILNAPPSVVWQYWLQPGRRFECPITLLETVMVFTPNEQGRLGPGASSHCAHGDVGDAFREYLDWRPYEYFTCRFTPVGPNPLFMVSWIETHAFEDLGDGRTEQISTVRCIDRSEASMALFEPIRRGMEAREANRDSAAPGPHVAAVDTGAEVFGVVDASTP
jgi:hypothetical protein